MLQASSWLDAIIHLSLVFPRGGGGGPRADVGEFRDYMGTLQQIFALVVGEMWGHRFLNALLSGRGECGDFASVQLRGDWKRSIVHSIDGKMGEEKKKVSFKIWIRCILHDIIQTTKSLKTPLSGILSPDKQLTRNFIYDFWKSRQQHYIIK